MANCGDKVKASHLSASVKDQLQKYICPKCEFILQDAVQTTCGTRLCQDCAEEFFSKKTRDLSLPCCPRPDCGEKLATEQLDFFPDEAVRRELKLLPVECRCGWKGNFGVFCDQHIEECSLICDLCNESFPFIEYQSHVNNCSASKAPLPKSHVGVSQETSQASIEQHTGLVTSHGAMVASAPPSSSFRIPQSHNSGVPPSTKRFVLISNERSEFPDHKVGGTIGIGEIGEAEGGVKIEEEAGARVQARRSESLSVKDLQEKIQMLENKVEQLENNQSMLFDKIYDTESRITIVERSTFNDSFLLKIQGISKRREDARTGKCISMDSPPFHSKPNGCGYKMCLRLYILGDGIGKGTHMSLFFVVMKGEFDNILQWPFTHKVTFKLVNQCGGGCDVVESICPDPFSSSFQKPKSDMNVASGCPRFVSIKELLQEGFIVDDTIFIKVEVDTSNGVNQAP